MDNHKIRINMIKIFALGIKYANAGIIDDDFFHSNMFEDLELFDNGDEPATFKQIMERLDNISCSYREEKRKTLSIASSVRRNNEIIGLLQNKLPELRMIGLE